MVLKIIGFGHISLIHLNLVLASAFYLLRSYAFLKLKMNYGIWEANHPIFLTLIMFLGESVVGIFDKIRRIRNKKEKEQISKTEKKIYHVSLNKVNKSYMSKRKQVPHLITIFGIVFLEFCAFFGTQYTTLYYENASNVQTQIRSLKLIFDSILCYLLLKIRIHRHHYLSIFIVILGIFLVTLQDVLIKSNSNYVLFFIFTSHSLIISIRDSLEKWLIDTKFLNAIRLLFLRGAIGSVISFILGIIFYFASDSRNIFESFAMIFTSNAASIIWFIVYFICCIFYNFFYSLVKQYFSPTHMGVSDAFSTVMWMIILQLMPSYSNNVNWALLISGYVLVVFGCFVYNDIIILYFCGLDHNTKYEVSLRGTRETKFNELEIYKDRPLFQTEIKNM